MDKPGISIRFAQQTPRPLSQNHAVTKPSRNKDNGTNGGYFAHSAWIVIFLRVVVLVVGKYSVSVRLSPSISGHGSVTLPCYLSIFVVNIELQRRLVSP